MSDLFVARKYEVCARSLLAGTKRHIYRHMTPTQSYRYSSFSNNPKNKKRDVLVIAVV